jgi:ABC-type ATPase with predicted acetyltransferase domain
MQLTTACQRPVAPQPSANVLAVAQMFGLGLDAEQQATIIPPVTLPLEPRSVMFVTGASGSGKSTLLSLIREQLASDARPAVLTFEALAAPADRPLVDAFGHAPLEAVLRWLSLAGLNDAWVMLRRPSELSDGQRYRLKLVRLMQQVEHQHGDRASQSTDNAMLAEDVRPAAVVLADEFGATLDRPTAKALAKHLRKWTRQWPVCFIAATTHDDLLESWQPDVLVETQLDGSVEVLRASSDGDQ